LGSFGQKKEGTPGSLSFLEGMTRMCLRLADQKFSPRKLSATQFANRTETIGELFR
jgi:hypothetical protein